MLSIFLCTFLISVISIRYLTPFSDNLNHKLHSTLLAVFLGAAADIVDFVEYANEETIVKKIGVHAIFGEYYLNQI